MPVSALRTGDRIVVHAGEMIPVAGVITQGVAWVKQRGLPADASALLDLRQVGSRVEASTIVQVGCIWVAVECPGKFSASEFDRSKSGRTLR